MDSTNISTVDAFALTISNPDLKTLVFKLWKRYHLYELKNDIIRIKESFSRLKTITEVSEKTITIIKAIMDSESEEDISANKPRIFQLNNVFDDNNDNREAGKKILKYMLKNGSKYILDHNEGGLGRLTYHFSKPKEKKLFGFTKDLDEAIEIYWGGHNKTDYSGITCKEGTGRQGFHTDFNKFTDINDNMKPLVMSMLGEISLSNNNYFYCLETNDDNTISTVRRIFLPFGSVLFFSGNYIHAGQEYIGENCRAHRYIESHNMIHGATVSQDFKSYVGHTISMNDIT
jgi:hypothetical protein